MVPNSIVITLAAILRSRLLKMAAEKKKKKKTIILLPGFYFSLRQNFRIFFHFVKQTEHKHGLGHPHTVMSGIRVFT